LEDKEKHKKKQPKFIALTGIAVQMGVTIYLFSYLGKYIDEKYLISQNYWTIGLTMLGLVVAFYVLLKQLKSINGDS